MKISFQWLKEYVDVHLTPKELAEVLTHSGLEVENLSETNPPFQGVIVARLRSFHSHPQNDHLSLCTVHDGRKDYSIVCGAPNLKVGEKVALALEGATLPSGTKIEKSYFQGVLSEGMLCSEKELGLSDDAAGIMLLEPTLTLGSSLDTALPLKDWILEINVTPNRSDCLCLLGIAREVAALTGQSLRYPPKGVEKKTSVAESQTSVNIERADLCPRYAAQLIFGVHIAPSPFGMRRRLEALGIRSINNVVDATNYVMLEMGQPLHAFDFDRLEERRIVVRTACPRELFTTLDGVARLMPEEALMICDGKRPVALAGIMGGLNSEVSPETKNILLESAYFDPMGIRRTSKRIGLSTEASLRFERGIDPNGCVRAADRAASLMVEFGGGSLPHGSVDNYPRPILPCKIRLRVSRVNQILGTAILAQEIRRTLEKLELETDLKEEDGFQVTPPTFRVDLRREIDLIEEVARLHGFHRIPVTLPSGTLSGEKKTKMQRVAQLAKRLLNSFGFWEVINYSFISPKMLKDLKLPMQDPRARALRIHNPLNEEQSIMRPTLIPGLLQVASTNAHRQNFNLKIFEMGKVFFPREGQELPEEIAILSGLLTGLRQEESWSAPREESNFFDLKGFWEVLGEGLGIENCRFLPAPDESFLHSGKSCRIESGGKILGIMGEVHPEVAESYELKPKAFLFELNFQKIAEEASEHRTFRPLARYPAVTRDLSLIVEDRIAAGDLLQTLWDANKGLINEINLFDLYREAPIPQGKKSLAFRLKYQGEDRTLTDQEVNELHQGIINLVRERHGATLR